MKAHQLKARILYLLSEAGGSNVKVGVTLNQQSLGRRVTNLQAGNSRKLSVAATYTFNVDGQAYSVEQATLRELNMHRVGEWLCDVSIDYVKGAIVVSS